MNLNRPGKWSSILLATCCLTAQKSMHCFTTHYCRYWYWILVSLEANTTGYWVLGGLTGIVPTLAVMYCTVNDIFTAVPMWCVLLLNIWLNCVTFWHFFINWIKSYCIIWSSECDIWYMLFVLCSLVMWYKFQTETWAWLSLRYAFSLLLYCCYWFLLKNLVSY